MPMMTLRRLGVLHARAKTSAAKGTDLVAAIMAIGQRKRERNVSKLARRMHRKHELGRAGAF